MAKCREKTKAGKRCKAQATANGLCSIHQAPGRAAELSKKAVEARQQKAKDAAERARMIVAEPKTPQDLKVIISRTIVAVLAGKIDDSTARSVASLGTVLLKAIDQADIAKEIQKLHELLDTRKSGTVAVATSIN
jgi:hypothetical protein